MIEIMSTQEFYEFMRNTIDSRTNGPVQAGWPYFRILTNDPDPTRIKIRELHMVDWDLGSTLFSSVDFIDCLFENCSFAGSNFENVVLENCRFINCNFPKTEFTITGRNVIFNKSSFFRTCISRSNFIDCIISECELGFTEFFETTMENVDFSKSHIFPAFFVECSFKINRKALAYLIYLRTKDCYLYTEGEYKPADMPTIRQEIFNALPLVDTVTGYEYFIRPAYEVENYQSTHAYIFDWLRMDPEISYTESFVNLLVMPDEIQNDLILQGINNWNVDHYTRRSSPFRWGEEAFSKALEKTLRTIIKDEKIIMYYGIALFESLKL
jgi:hypothetical protein